MPLPTKRTRASRLAKLRAENDEQFMRDNVTVKVPAGAVDMDMLKQLEPGAVITFTPAPKPKKRKAKKCEQDT